MKLLLHTSKTMTQTISNDRLTTPVYMQQACQLMAYLKQADSADTARIMAITPKVMQQVADQIAAWRPDGGTAAVLTFRGDIYSGLQAASWSKADKEYAQQHLIILSGLYGVLRPFDAIWPYRMEMGYRFVIDGYTNLASYWQDQLRHAIPGQETVINLTAQEYYRAIKPYMMDRMVVEPQFLTWSDKHQEPRFVTVHAKIARGAFASWVIQQRIQAVEQLMSFTELGYCYDASRSTLHQPVFICQQFGGLGLSVRLAQ